MSPTAVAAKTRARLAMEQLKDALDDITKCTDIKVLPGLVEKAGQYEDNLREATRALVFNRMAELENLR